MKMGGGDGDQAAAKPGFSSGGNPYQKPKTQRIWTTIFLKMGGDYSRTLKIGGTRPPVAEPLTIIFKGELFPLSSVHDGHRHKILVWPTDLNQ